MIIWENDNELFESILQALDEFGWDVADRYKMLLEGDKKRATGKLINSIKYFVTNSAEGGEYTVSLELEDYWKYVEAGLRGHNGRRKNSDSPIPAPRNWLGAAKYILDWIREKGIQPRPDKNGHLPTEEQLSYAIARSIHNEGIKKGGQLEEAVRAVSAYGIPRLQAALEKDWERLSIEIYDGINKNLQI